MFTIMFTIEKVWIRAWFTMEYYRGITTEELQQKMEMVS